MMYDLYWIGSDIEDYVCIGTKWCTPKKHSGLQVALIFDCTSLYSTANSFLKMLAKETGGRYHQLQSNFDAQLYAHKLLAEGFKDPEVGTEAKRAPLSI